MLRSVAGRDEIGRSNSGLVPSEQGQEHENKTLRLWALLNMRHTELLSREECEVELNGALNRAEHLRHRGLQVLYDAENEIVELQNQSKKVWMKLKWPQQRTTPWINTKMRTDSMRGACRNIFKMR